MEFKLLETEQPKLDLEKPELVQELIPKKEEESIPKEFHWILHLKRIQKRLFEEEGRTVIFTYGYMEQGEMVFYDDPKPVMDSEHQSWVPGEPNRVRMLEHVPGVGTVVRRTFEGVSRIDPDIDTAERIWGLFGSF